MNEEELNVFVDTVLHYFDQVTDTPAIVQTPYLKENKDTLAYEFTGIIGISGERKGCVYFTTTSLLLNQILIGMREDDLSKENQADLIGELANTIAGNARKHFGIEFMISVPIVIEGKPENLKLPKTARSFVIPVSWRHHESALVVCLDIFTRPVNASL